MSEQQIIQPQSNVIGILAIVFAIIGIFLLGIVFCAASVYFVDSSDLSGDEKEGFAHHSRARLGAYDRGLGHVPGTASRHRHRLLALD